MSTPDRSLSLILSGAVSLGSFEAGVLDELLYTLEYLHQHDGPRFTLDVMTGASAGSMTGALVARALMHDFALRSTLHEAWVERINIEQLTKQIPPTALLDSTPIDQIAAELLTARDLTTIRRPAIAPETLYMTFMVSNMNGIDFTLPCTLRQSASFTSTFYSERRTFVLNQAQAADIALWDRIREAAKCSGDFPIAFKPRMMASDASAVEGMAGTMLDQYCYVDGGMFNNEPIREAVRLAALADGGSVAADRKFLLVDANINQSTANPKFNADAPFAAIAGRLMAALFSESAANDWLRAQRFNTELAWRDSLAAQLADIVRNNDVGNVEELIADLDSLGRGIIGEKARLFPARYPNVDDAYRGALDATRSQHADIFVDVSPGRTQVLERILFLLNNVAGLQKKSRLDIDVIYAERKDTAGDLIFAFGGFFEREWREHDYRVGRRKTRELLPKMLEFDAELVPEEKHPSGASCYVPDRDCTGETLRDTNRQEREKLRKAVAVKAGNLAREHAPKFPLAGWAVARVTQSVVGKKVGALLELDA